MTTKHLSPSKAERDSLEESIHEIAGDLAGALVTAAIDRADGKGFEQALQNEHARAAKLEEERDAARAKLDGFAVVASERDEALRKLRAFIGDAQGLRDTRLTEALASVEALKKRLADQGLIEADSARLLVERDQAREALERLRLDCQSARLGLEAEQASLMEALRAELDKREQDEESLSSTLSKIITEASRVVSGGLSGPAPEVAVGT